MARKYWWPGTLPEQLAIMQNVLGKIGGYAGVLGLTGGQVDRIENCCATYIAVYNWVEATRETAGSLVEWRDDFFYRPGGGTPPPAPTFLAYTGVAGSEAGVVNEFKAARDLIVNLPGFTDAIGDDLMFIGEETSSLVPADVKPTVKAFPASTGYLATIVVGERADSDMWEVWTLAKGASVWEKEGNYTGKSADITFAPATPGDPSQFQLRIQLRKANANYGQVSDAVTLTVNP